jgi:uncharacterized protein (TIGR03435 family)
MQNRQTFRSTSFLVGIVTVIAIMALRAQAPAPETKLPAFEVASVKRNTSSDPATVGGGFFPGGRYIAKDITVRALIREAYRVQGFQIVGGPSWITADKFDILAKAEGDPKPGPGDPLGPPPIIFLMLRSLLAERFKVAVHNETRDLPIYAIVMAKSDGSLGPQLRAPAIDCSTYDFRNAPAPPPGGFCGGIRGGPGTMMGKGATMRQLALNLSPRLGRVVLDRTGLSGSFDLDLAWTPVGPADASANGVPTASADAGPSIFTALQEQLGLKVESTKGPVDVLVIDHVQHPTSD